MRTEPDGAVRGLGHGAHFAHGHAVVSGDVPPGATVEYGDAAAVAIAVGAPYVAVLGDEEPVDFVFSEAVFSGIGDPSLFRNIPVVDTDSKPPECRDIWQ